MLFFNWGQGGKADSRMGDKQPATARQSSALPSRLISIRSAIAGWFFEMHFATCFALQKCRTFFAL